MEEESTAKLLSIEDRPATPRDPITFIRSLEGEFDRRQVLTLDHPIVEIRLDCQQAESAVTFGLQRQVGRIHQVEIFDVPQFRLDDAPRTEERLLRSSTCRHVIHARSPIGLRRTGTRHKRNQPELIRLLLEVAWHHADVDHHAVDEDHPHQRILGESARDRPPRIQ